MVSELCSSIRSDQRIESASLSQSCVSALSRILEQPLFAVVRSSFAPRNINMNQPLLRMLNAQLTWLTHFTGVGHTLIRFSGFQDQV